MEFGPPRRLRSSQVSGVQRSSFVSSTSKLPAQSFDEGLWSARRRPTKGTNPLLASRKTTAQAKDGSPHVRCDEAITIATESLRRLAAAVAAVDADAGDDLAASSQTVGNQLNSSLAVTSARGREEDVAGSASPWQLPVAPETPPPMAKRRSTGSSSKQRESSSTSPGGQPRLAELLQSQLANMGDSIDQLRRRSSALACSTDSVEPCAKATQALPIGVLHTVDYCTNFDAPAHDATSQQTSAGSKAAQDIAMNSTFPARLAKAARAQETAAVSGPSAQAVAQVGDIEFSSDAHGFNEGAVSRLPRPDSGWRFREDELIVTGQERAHQNGCRRCNVLDLQAKALVQALVGLGARCYNWTAGLAMERRAALAQIVLEYLQPCAHLDRCLKDLCSELQRVDFDDQIGRAMDKNTDSSRLCGLELGTSLGGDAGAPVPEDRSRDELLEATLLPNRWEDVYDTSPGRASTAARVQPDRLQGVFDTNPDPFSSVPASESSIARSPNACRRTRKPPKVRSSFPTASQYPGPASALTCNQEGRATPATAVCVSLSPSLSSPSRVSCFSSSQHSIGDAAPDFLPGVSDKLSTSRTEGGGPRRRPPIRKDAAAIAAAAAAVAVSSDATPAAAADANSRGAGHCEKQSPGSCPSPREAALAVDSGFADMAPNRKGSNTFGNCRDIVGGTTLEPRSQLDRSWTNEEVGALCLGHAWAPHPATPFQLANMSVASTTDNQFTSNGTAFNDEAAGAWTGSNQDWHVNSASTDLVAGGADVSVGTSQHNHISCVSIDFAAVGSGASVGASQHNHISCVGTDFAAVRAGTSVGANQDKPISCASIDFAAGIADASAGAKQDKRISCAGPDLLVGSADASVGWSFDNHVTNCGIDFLAGGADAAGGIPPCARVPLKRPSQNNRAPSIALHALQPCMTRPVRAPFETADRCKVEEGSLREHNRRETESIGGGDGCWQDDTKIQSCTSISHNHGLDMTAAEQSKRQPIPNCDEGDGSDGSDGSGDEIGDEGFICNEAGKQQSSKRDRENHESTPPPSHHHQAPPCGGLGEPDLDVILGQGHRRSTAAECTIDVVDAEQRALDGNAGVEPPEHQSTLVGSVRQHRGSKGPAPSKPQMPRFLARVAGMLSPVSDCSIDTDEDDALDKEEASSNHEGEHAFNDEHVEEDEGDSQRFKGGCTDHERDAKTIQDRNVPWAETPRRIALYIPPASISKPSILESDAEDESVDESPDPFVKRSDSSDVKPSALNDLVRSQPSSISRCERDLQGRRQPPRRAQGASMRF